MARVSDAHILGNDWPNIATTELFAFERSEKPRLSDLGATRNTLGVQIRHKTVTRGHAICLVPLSDYGGARRGDLTGGRGYL